MSASKWKPYSEYKDSNVNGLGKIPYHWSVERIATLGRISKGSGGSKEDNVDSGLPCIRYGDLYTHHNFVVKDFKTQISAESASRYTTLEKGDILFAASGESIDEIGKSVLFNLDETAYCGGDNIICKTGGTDDSDFLGFATNAPYFAAQKSMIGRGFTVLHIYGTQLRDLRLALPPLDERKAISKFISQTKNLLDSQISKLGNLLPLLEEKRSALITQAVTKGLNPHVPMKDSGIEWIDEIPEHWSVKPIKYSIPLRTERLQEIPLDSTYLALEHIESGSGKIIEESQTETVESSVTVFEENDVLFGKLRPYLAKVVFPNFSGVCSNELIVLQTSSKSEAEYFQKVLISNPFIQYVNARTDGVKMPRASPDVIAGIKLPHPPISEMNEIGTYLKRVNEEISDVSDMIYSQIAKLQEYQIALISAAVTGKIDVRSL